VLSLSQCSLIFNEKKLNFVFILVDDLGWRDVGCYGSSFYETPNTDRLANEGIRFTNAYAAAPVCSPTRASIMTGKYPARMNTTDWFGAPQPGTVQNHWTRNKPILPAEYEDQLILDEVTIAETFRDAGYATFFAGKWHLGGVGFYPEDQGFEINVGGHERGWPPGGYFSPYKNPKLTDGKLGEHLPDRLANECISFLENSGDNPFLLFLSFYSVHTPLQAPDSLVAKYEDKAKLIEQQEPHFEPEGERQARQVQNHAIYAAMVESMDSAIGKVLKVLEHMELSDHTAVILMSDNGGLSTSEGSPTSNVPLRAGKGWLYEGGIREPMIIKWPGIVKPGSVSDQQVISTDFYPTKLDMAGLSLKPKQHLDGISLVPLLKLQIVLPPRSIFWHYPHYGDQGGSPGAAVRVGDFKLIHFFEDNRIEMYNLEADIGETENLSAKMPKKKKELLSLLYQWQNDVGARMTSKNPAHKKERIE
jgi:arylsulfatase A-like enzyme